ncbi:MAG: hypothetical protein H7330_14425 [Hymenobacteraceae bacterium]|nr:hypothetical protein [Hymenobacteraceae bacterium]
MPFFRCFSLRAVGAWLVLLGGPLFFLACEPQEDIVTTNPGATLTASVETVRFDTVFTNRGSITKRFWVYNRNAKAVRVDEIGLAGKPSAVATFLLIINGRETTILRNFELRGKDSVLVLVKVTIDPTAVDTVFLVPDSVLLRANGTTRYVRLRAYGENARYYDAPPGFAPVIACGDTWTDRRPIVLLKTAIVDANCVLTIDPGTRVYLAKNASLLVRGRLRCGSLAPDAKPVKFRGLRRDDFFDTTDPRYADLPLDLAKYANTPAQWGAIILEEQPGSQLTQEDELFNTDIRNSTVGVFISGTLYLRGQRVRIENCFIRYAYVAGVYGEAAGFGGGVEMVNTVVSRCGERAVINLGGGTWHLAHCTLDMSGAIFGRRDTEALYFDNALTLPSGRFKSDHFITFENSILWSGLRDNNGDLQNEIRLIRQSPADDSLFTFRHSVLQTPFARFNTDGVHYGRGEAGTNVLNEDPRFRDAAAPVKLDLRLDSLRSPARRLGEALSPPVPLDLRNDPMR